MLLRCEVKSHSIMNKSFCFFGGFSFSLLSSMAVINAVDDTADVLTMSEQFHLKVNSVQFLLKPAGPPCGGGI